MPVASSPSTTLYTLGRGILYIAEWSDDVAPTNNDWEDIGDCQEFNAEVTEERLEHFTRRSGTRLKDKTVVLETGYNVSFVLNESSVNNLKYYLKGTLSGTNVIMAGTALLTEYALKFESDNPAGPNERWEFWKCELSPNGALNLISDEWRAIPFTGSGLADTANHATSPYFNVTVLTTTTTTTV